MICHNCGSKIEHYTRFCSTCGAAQKAGDTDPDGVLRTTQMERPEIRVPRWRLSKMEGLKIPDGFPLQARTRLGRDPRCEIVLPSPNISRYHAQIEWSDSGFQISDLGSTNGTYVNRKLIKEPTRIKIGATVQLGEYTFLVMKDSTICGSCGETVRSDDRYCEYCGNSLIGPELQPDRSAAGALLVEEPFPETTPVPVVGETTGGLQTPKYNTPPFIPGSERPRLQEKPAPPTMSPPVRRSATAPPPPPPPPSSAVSSVSSVSAAAHSSGRKRSLWRTLLIIVAVGLCGLLALGAFGYYLYTTGALGALPGI